MTPEAIKPLFRREMDGFSAVFHQASLGTVGVSTLQSRAFAGQIGGHVRLLPARLDRRLPRRLGPGARARARQPLPALLARRADPAPQGHSAHEQAQPCRRGRPGAHGRRHGQGADRPARRPPPASCAARPATLDQVRAGTAPKGAVIQTAELAGVMAAKRTADLIPLCHPLPLTKAAVTIEMDDELPGFRVASEIRTHGVDRRRDGGADRGLGRLPHLVRHAEGDRPDDDDRRHRGDRQDRRQIGRRW